MLDNLSLPQPPTATGTPVYIRYTFYSIPFSKTGENVFLPVATEESDIATELYTKKYLKYEVVTNRGFRSEQSSLILPIDNTTQEVVSLVDNCNYCRIAVVRQEQEELYNYLYDRNVQYYWIDECEFLSIFNDFRQGALQLNISKDYIMTHFLVNRTANAPTVTGNVEITNDSSFKNNENVKPLIEANYKGTTAKIDTIIDAYSSYALIVCYTDKSSALYAEVVKCNEGRGTANPYDTYLNLIECVELASNAASVMLGSAQLGAISIKKIYALPLEWVERKIAPTSVGVKETDNGLKLYSFNNLQELHNNSMPVFEYSGLPNNVPKNIYDRYFLKFPSKQIELTGNPLSENFFNFAIFIDLPACGPLVSATGGATDSIVFKLYANGEYIDISDVFSIDFAVNEAALRQNQFKELTALESVAAVVGAVGGVAGGVASGNYFGAIQVAVGGIEKVGEIISANKHPAQLRTAGSFTNGLVQYGLISLIAFNNPANVIDLNEIEQEYGWAHTSITPATLHTVSGEKFYKFTNVSVTNLPLRGETAAAIIAARFEQGIRFKELPVNE